MEANLRDDQNALVRIRGSAEGKDRHKSFTAYDEQDDRIDHRTLHVGTTQESCKHRDDAQSIQRAALGNEECV